MKKRIHRDITQKKMARITLNDKIYLTSPKEGKNVKKKKKNGWDKWKTISTFQI